MKTEQELKDNFQKWVEKGLWQGEDEYTKNFAVGNVADYWLTVLTEYKASIRSEVEKMNKEPNFIGLDDGDSIDENKKYNQALQDVLDILK
jgi:hypothetical protein